MPKKNIVGREREIKTLDQLWKSKEAEFLALYGRRRVGKTYLIREYFSENNCVYFEISGEKDGNLHNQLENFTHLFSQSFYNGLSLLTPSHWKDAFELLTKEIQKIPQSKKIVLFFDELPWLAGKKSGILQALDYYWNSFWSKQRNLILIVCGSAASWMLENLINAKGGLHNRLTKTILLKPYPLHGVKIFLQSRNIVLTEKQVLDLFMVFGGIPYYLKQIEKGKSATQIINRVCFQSDGLLYSEFDRLFGSLFEHAEINLAMIRAIAKKRHGLSRGELIKNTSIASGGTLNKRLRELEAAGFIQKYVPYGNKKKEHYYRIIDEYCYFYLTWIEPIKNSGMKVGKSYWQTKSKTAPAISWSGYAFENICLKHTDQIQEALELQEIACEIGSWRYVPAKRSDDTGAQIDLLFDRADGIISLCEIKHSENIFSVDKSYAKVLKNKIEVFEKHFPTKKQIFLTLITTMGAKSTIWSEEIIHNQVTLKDLFKF